MCLSCFFSFGMIVLFYCIHRKEHQVISAHAYVHPSAFVEEGAEIEDKVKVWHFCHVRKNAVLENSVSLGKDVYIDVDVRVGRHSRIQNGVSVYQGLKIAPWCFIGPHAIFTNDQTPRVGSKVWNVVETNLEFGMSIGAGAVIRCGITIGAFAMIGAGAIVTKDVPAFHLAIGFPAQVQQMICACAQSFHPLGTPFKEMLQPCCKANLLPEPYNEAQKIISKLTQG